MIYHTIASRLTERGRLRLDAILGDPDAVAQREAERQRALSAFARRPS